jgi:hypothetical protein
MISFIESGLASLPALDQEYQFKAIKVILPGTGYRHTTPAGSSFDYPDSV